MITNAIGRCHILADLADERCIISVKCGRIAIQYEGIFKPSDIQGIVTVTVYRLGSGNFIDVATNGGAHFYRSGFCFCRIKEIAPDIITHIITQLMLRIHFLNQFCSQGVKII